MGCFCQVWAGVSASILAGIEGLAAGLTWVARPAAFRLARISGGRVFVVDALSTLICAGWLPQDAVFGPGAWCLGTGVSSSEGACS